MLRFTFESFFKDKKELREELAHLLWQIDYTWPSDLHDLNWVKEKADRAFVKLNGGVQHITKEVSYVLYYRRALFDRRV